MTKRTLHIDLETRSTLDLKKVGVYVYAAHPTTEIITVAWALDDEPVWATRLDDGQRPTDLMEALADPSVTVCAHNAGFERVMIERLAGPRDDWPVPTLDRWDCTAARAARQALPRSLDGAAKAMHLDVRKDEAGHRRMLQMSKPRFIREDGSVVWWEDDARFDELLAYNARDVEVERALDRVLYPLPDDERAMWQLTEIINDRGVPVDLEFVRNAQEAARLFQRECDLRIHSLTGGAVTGVKDLRSMKAWLGGIDTLDKAALSEMLKGSSWTPAQREVLEIRQAAGKSSNAKLDAFLQRADADGRVRGNLVWHRASTGRYAGAGVQLQNLPRPGKGDGEEEFYRDVIELPYDQLFEKYPDFLTKLSGSLRGAVSTHALSACLLYRADYAAVEARGVAWLARSQKLLDAFLSGADVYKVMASLIFKKPVAEVSDDERFIGKQVVLGCGYGLGPAKFQAMCAGFGRQISMELAELAVRAYRSENPEIPALWRGLEGAAIAAVGSPGKITSYNGIRFCMHGVFLVMMLPSGRKIFYCEPTVIEGRFGNPQLSFMAENPVTKQWGRETTWGGTLTENAVQGICYDLMANAMMTLEDMGLDPILSVHDELICEAPVGLSKRVLEQPMCLLPEWAEGFPLKAEGNVGARYGK
jgi:DNA polymerase bacteriophage-type